MTPSSVVREDDIRPKPLLDEFFIRLKRDADRLAARRAEFVEVPCAACGSPASDAAFEKDGFAYRLCSACGSLFVSPRPNAAALAEYAQTSEAVEFWSSHFYRQTAEARGARIFRPRAQILVDTAQRYGFEGPVRCADIGAGYGLFLRELRRAAPEWTLTAIEPDARLAAICLADGYQTVARWVEEIPDGDLTMDVVSAFEVLEHVFDPSVFLAACLRLLRPGGIAMVTTLTISGFDLQVLWEHSRSITPPQHLNFPAADAFVRLAARAGFEVVELTTPGELDVDIVRNVLMERPAVVHDRFARSIASADEAARHAFQRFLAEHRLSSHLRCVLRRP